MMQIADVVQDIFRALGIDGWETVGMEPADATIAARSADAGVERPESRGPRGVTPDPPRPAAMAQIPAEPSAGSILPSHAGEEMSAEAEMALASWLVER
jgi:hypothetical protein